MFYAHFVLNKRGPWARIWLAAHWDKKITKAHVFETDVESTVNSILSPQVKLALRTSGHLLLGVVRIYNRKSKYLLADCNEAFIKIKMAFRPGVVDLPEENREAQHNQIYLVDDFSDFNTPLPDINDISMTRNLTLNQSRLEEITMPEEVHSSFGMDDAFGGGIFDKDEHEQFNAGDLQSMFYKEDESGKDLGFGMKSFGEDDGGLLASGFMEGPGLFGDTDGFLAEDNKKQEDEEQPMETGEAPSSPIQNKDAMLTQEEQPTDINQTITTEMLPPINDTVASLADNTLQNTTDQTTLVANEEEAFVLEPLDVTVGVRDVRMRRKRKLVIDHNMELDGQTMREQMKDFHDIVISMDLAPPTKKLMQWKEYGGVEKLLTMTVNPLIEGVLKVFHTHLTSEIPAEIANVTSQHLEEIYGQDEVVDESSVHVAREQPSLNVNNASELPSMHINQSEQSIQMARDANNSLATPVAPAYHSDDDYAEPFSVNPPSVAPKTPEVSNVTPDMSAVHPDISMVAPEPELPSLHIADMSSIMVEDEQYPEGENIDELRWNKRTQTMLHELQRTFNHSEESLFFDITENANKKTAAAKFYALLVLAKQNAVELSQEEKFSVIYIKKGNRFDNLIM